MRYIVWVLLLSAGYSPGQPHYGNDSNAVEKKGNVTITRCYNAATKQLVPCEVTIGNTLAAIVEEHYDDRKNLAEEKYFDASGNPVPKYIGNGDSTVWIKYFYDRQNHLVKKEYCNAGGHDLLNSEYWKYNDKGQLVEKGYLLLNDTARVDLVQHLYNRDGNKTLTTYFSVPGHMSWEYETFYDSAGRYAGHQSRDSADVPLKNNEGFAVTEKVTYNGKGDIEKVSWYDGDGTPRVCLPGEYWGYPYTSIAFTYYYEKRCFYMEFSDTHSFVNSQMTQYSPFSYKKGAYNIDYYGRYYMKFTQLDRKGRVVLEEYYRMKNESKKVYRVTYQYTLFGRLKDYKKEDLGMFVNW